MWHDIVTRLPVSLGNAIVVGGETVIMIMTCLYCWVRGDRADRIAAAVFAVCWMGYEITFLLWKFFTGDLRPQPALSVVWDLLPASTFLYLCLRHDNLWFGGAAIAQGIQFALNAIDLAIREPFGTPLPIILISSMNALNLVMMAAMIGSVMSRTRPRRRGSQPA